MGPFQRDLGNGRTEGSGTCYEKGRNQSLSFTVNYSRVVETRC